MAGLDASKLCILTATFFDAGGNYREGVYVRFSPDVTSDEKLEDGWVAADITAVSDAAGQISMSVVQGAKGTLSVSGIGLVRIVEIPATTTYPLFSLVSGTDDLLEIQNPRYIDLPRRS